MGCLNWNMRKLTQDDALHMAEILIDSYFAGAHTDRSFTESEEAALGVAIYHWAKSVKIETED